MNMTKEERTIATAYTGILFCDWSTFHEFAERILERPVYTHEFASKKLWVEMKHLVKAQFMAMIEIPEDEA